MSRIAIRGRGAPGVIILALASVCLVCLVACGKAGPPLPPLVKLPVAPVDITADRRGATVDLQFTVPGNNTDNTRPANLARVDVLAITGPVAPTDEQLIKLATKVGSVDVKAPRDPNATADEDEPDADAPEGKGLDQGAPARVAEGLTPAALVRVDPLHDPRMPKVKTPADNADAGRVGRPLLPPPPTSLSRTYVAVGITTRGKRGPFSKRVTVPLVSPPAPPERATVEYDERTITVTWPAAAAGARVQRATADDELPSSPIGVNQITHAYNVYDSKLQSRLTKTPLTEEKYADSRIVWGEERCYVVRVAETIGGMTIESEASAPTCKTLKDTFPPAAPANLQSSPGEGLIGLIWDSNAEADLAGYIVFRGPESGALQQVTPTPIQESVFRDNVQPGVVYVYEVAAVDKAGNVSPHSKPIRETAR